MEIGQLWEIVDKVSTLALALLAIFAFHKGWIVTGRELTKTQSDCEYHRKAHERLVDRLEHSNNRLEQALDVARAAQRSASDRPAGKAALPPEGADESN